MDSNAIRMLDVPDEDIRKTNISNFVRIFRGIAKRPEDAKQLRNTIVISFKSYDSDSRPNCAIPQIRSFIQALDKAIPYFPYFLVSDPVLEHILFYVLCLVPFENSPNRSYSPAALLAVSEQKTTDVTEFCNQINDDPERATEPIFLSLPAEIVKNVPDLAEKVLDAMAPTLRALKSELTQPNITTEQEGFIQNFLSKAAVVSGLDRSRFATPASLLRALLDRIDRVSNEEIRRFEKSFEDCTMRVGDGKLSLSSTKLRQVIREQRHAAYRFVEIHLLMAASQPGYLQPAAIVAAGLMVEFNDLEPLRRVEQRAAELGATPEQWQPGTSFDAGSILKNEQKP